MRYVYLGDRLTDPRLRNMDCEPVRRSDGRCIVGKGKALVVDKWYTEYVVLRRRLRLTSKFYHNVHPIKIGGSHE
jgi:hypothetical protein